MILGAFDFCKTAFGNPNIEVNTAGVVFEGEKWRKTIDVNLVSQRVFDLYYLSASVFKYHYMKAFVRK